MKYLILILVYLVVVGGLAYGGFLLERWLHWEFYYGPQTQELICEMTNPEYLKPNACDDKF